MNSVFLELTITILCRTGDTLVTLAAKRMRGSGDSLQDALRQWPDYCPWPFSVWPLSTCCQLNKSACRECHLQKGVKPMLYTNTDQGSQRSEMRTNGHMPQQLITPALVPESEEWLNLELT